MKKITHPEYSNDMHHEVELVLLITEKIKNADDSEAKAAIGGYAVGLDMTLRDLQFELKEKGEPWTLAKCFDGSAVVSDFVEPDKITFTESEAIKLKVNENIKQSSTLDMMIFNSLEIVKYISSKMTLEEGDLILTGTPEGVGKVSVGDKLTAEIENVGSLKTEIIE